MPWYQCFASLGRPDGYAMNWSLSEFLNTFEFRSQSWCLVELSSGHAIRTPHSDAAYFYAVEHGEVRVAGIGGKEIALHAGEILLVLSGEAHTLRIDHGLQVETVSLLQVGGYVDVPPRIVLGKSEIAARLVCGRMKVRWPGGHRPRGMPAQLTIHEQQSLVRIDQLMATIRKEGGSAVLTHLANLLFVTAIRNLPECRALFSESNQLDPIAMARQYIELHPFQAWTVAALAKKVGMSRSNFAARFVTQTGKTPMDVLTEERMKMAAGLLERSDLKIAEISERVGYRSEAAFHFRFTTYFGASPGSFRRSHRAQASPFTAETVTA